MLARCFVLVLTIGAMACAQPLPAGWKIFKDDKGACQMSTPADWNQGMLPGMFKSSDGFISVSLVLNTQGQFKPMPELAMKMLGAVKVVENSDKRTFFEGKPSTFGPVPSTPWHIWIPAPKGSCNATVSLKKGADLAIARKVADSLQAVK